MNIPKGFYYYPEFLTVKEEKLLIKHIENLKWKQVKFHGVIAKRSVVHFGLDYTYATRQVTPTTPAPKYLSPYIKRAAKLLGISSSDIVEILITKYPPGAGIGWHRDAPIFGEKVFGISLAAPCVFKLRHPKDVTNPFIIQMEQRSAYILGGEARKDWYHTIPGVKNLRYSITFRTLKNI